METKREKGYRLEVKLQSNEFTDYTDAIGFFETDSEPQQYLTIGDLAETNGWNLVGEKDSVIYDRPNTVYYPSGEEGAPEALPTTYVDLVLYDKAGEFERKKYTIFTLLGDVGGFNAAITILPAFIMSYYSERMFQKSLSGETPIRRPRKKPKLFD